MTVCLNIFIAKKLADVDEFSLIYKNFRSPMVCKSLYRFLIVWTYLFVMIAVNFACSDFNSDLHTNNLVSDLL